MSQSFFHSPFSAILSPLDATLFRYYFGTQYTCFPACARLQQHNFQDKRVVVSYNQLKCIVQLTSSAEGKSMDFLPVLQKVFNKGSGLSGIFWGSSSNCWHVSHMLHIKQTDKNKTITYTLSSIISAELRWQNEVGFYTTHFDLCSYIYIAFSSAHFRWRCFARLVLSIITFAQASSLHAAYVKYLQGMDRYTAYDLWNSACHL